jgi:hypothetical protein
MDQLNKVPVAYYGSGQTDSVQLQDNSQNLFPFVQPT